MPVFQAHIPANRYSRDQKSGGPNISMTLNALR
jgi:hypothetical protein